MGEDLTMVVKSFFCGHELPKFVTHTNLILLPKKELRKKNSDFRPISFSCFLNKAISRVLHERMFTMLPKIISPNQAGFVKERSIIKNVLLAQ